MRNTDNSNNSTNAPTHFAYQVREGKEKSHWTRIGAVWAHKDSKGFSIQLESIPLDGKLSLRTASENK